MKRARQTLQTFHGLLITASIITLGAAQAHKSPADFSTEPDKTPAAANVKA